MKFAALAYKTLNIGDDLQSFSIINLVNGVDCFLDRECLADAYLDSPHHLVMNTWYKLGNDTRLPSRRINPIFHGFSVGNDELFDKRFLNYISNFSPIGCRDLWSVDFLKKNGIDAYWSGCSSIFAGSFLKNITERTDTILNYDVPSAFLKKYAPPEIFSKLITSTNHVPYFGRDDALYRFGQVERFLRKLASAKLVITRRLHIALPCIGLGIPVIVFPDERLSNSRRRFSGVERMLPIYFQQDVESGQKIDWNPKPAIIHQEITEAFEKLKEMIVVKKDSESCFNSELSFNLDKKLRLSSAKFGNRPHRVFISMPGYHRELRIEDINGKEITTDLELFHGLNNINASVYIQNLDSHTPVKIGYLNKLRVN